MHVEKIDLLVNLCHAWSVLVDLLGRLADEGSMPAEYLWDKLPQWAPTSCKRELMAAIRTSGRMAPLGDVLPEWLAYTSALAAFARAPRYVSPPMPMPAGVLAALDSGQRLFVHRGYVPVRLTRCQTA